MVEKHSFVTQLLWLSYLALGILTTSGQPYSEVNDDLYDYETSDNDDTIEDRSEGEAKMKLLSTPKFLSQPQAVLVNEGDTIKLPCIVDRLEGFVILWKKNNDIVTVASQIIDKRVRLQEEGNGSYLLLDQAKPQDEGVFICQISAYKQTELSHNVQIRVKPEISTVPEDLLIVNASSGATLECNILSGNPLPELKWVKEDREKNTITDLVHDSTLTITDVTRNDAGTYLCMADNGFGPLPVQKGVRMEVHYAPEIEVEESVIHTSLGSEEELVCQVSALPLATVSWQKDGKSLDRSTPGLLIHQGHSRHSLAVLDITKDSEGQYECVATNSQGQTRMKIMLTGLAREAIILSPTESLSQTSYNLEWTVQSRSPISEFEVSVRVAGDTDWEVYEVTVDKPEVAGSEDTLGDWSLELTELLPGTLYQVTVASRNTFGITQPGKPFTFSTKEPDPVHQPMVTKTVSSASRVSLSLLVTAIASLL